jgi:hypothetical protein
MYNLTMMRFHLIIVAVEWKYVLNIMCVCVCVCLSVCLYSFLSYTHTQRKLSTPH